MMFAFEVVETKVEDAKKFAGKGFSYSYCGHCALKES